MALITYEDKVTLNKYPDIPEKNKVTADNMNEIKRAINSLIDVFYPVGSYYETSDGSFNPNTAWGGTWVEDTAGLVLVANTQEGTFSKIGTSVGEEEHSHGAGNLVACYDPKNTFNNALFKLKDADYQLSGYMSESRTWSSGGGGASRGIEVVGNTLNASNIQPSKIVARWHRTA